MRGKRNESGSAIATGSGNRPSNSRTIRVRAARGGDRSFVLQTASRLAAFGPPPWRTPEELVEGEARTLRDFFESPDDGTRVLIAEAGDSRLGFVLIEELRDYFTLDRHGHVGILAVTAAAEGRGAGRALLRAAESWARERGFQTLTLNVFSANDHARAVYEHLGFEEETVKYVKRI
jgi:ribosomal protein S18 acetylase RimI-like enzyme